MCQPPDHAILALDKSSAYCRTRGKVHRACLRLPTCLSMCSLPRDQRQGKQWLSYKGAPLPKRVATAPKRGDVFIVERRRSTVQRRRRAGRPRGSPRLPGSSGPPSEAKPSEAQTKRGQTKRGQT